MPAPALPAEQEGGVPGAEQPPAAAVVADNAPGPPAQAEGCCAAAADSQGAAPWAGEADAASSAGASSGECIDGPAVHAVLDTAHSRGPGQVALREDEMADLHSGSAALYALFVQQQLAAAQALLAMATNLVAAMPAAYDTGALAF